jgi:hypothetical protein
MSSPTQRSLKYLRLLGYRVEIVERWIPGANIRRDLFGFIDLLAIKDGEVLAVQTTSGSNVAARVAKIASDELAGAVADVRKLGWSIHVHGWRKNSKRRYVLREIDVS